MLQTRTFPGWHMLTPSSVAHSGRASGTIPLPQQHVPAHFTPSLGTLHSILKCTFLAWGTTTTLRIANYQQGCTHPSEAGRTLDNTRECLFRHYMYDDIMSMRPVVVRGLSHACITPTPHDPIKSSLLIGRYRPSLPLSILRLWPKRLPHRSALQPARL